MTSQPITSERTEPLTREIMTWDLFGSASRELAEQVAASGFEPDILLGIARGGLIPAGALAYALDCKNLFTISVESTPAWTSGSRCPWCCPRSSTPPTSTTPGC